MNYSLSTAAEDFVPSHAPLKNNKHLNIPFQSTQPRRGKNKSELQGLTPSSRVLACGMRRGVWGRASILSVMPKVAPNTTWWFTLLRPHSSYYWSCMEMKLRNLLAMQFFRRWNSLLGCSVCYSVCVHKIMQDGLSLSIESYMEFLQSFQSGLEKAVSLRLDPRAQQSGLQGLEKSFEK